MFKKTSRLASNRAKGTFCWSVRRREWSCCPSETDQYKHWPLHGPRRAPHAVCLLSTPRRCYTSLSMATLTETTHLAAIHREPTKNLRRIKEWICSERPITICAIVKAWLCQMSRICPKGDVTRRQRPMRALVSFTLQRNLRNNMTFELFAATSLFRLTGSFHIHLFYLSMQELKAKLIAGS